ncbi:hypothetical protein EE612_057617 [Oryza sativa]|nr:hypothetical protein EE612_057617 [Oryza sativa]
MAAGDAATPLLVLETAYQYHEGCPCLRRGAQQGGQPGHPLHALLPHLDHHPRLMFANIIVISLLILHDKRLACCKKSRGHWILCRFCRCVIYVW